MEAEKPHRAHRVSKKKKEKKEGDKHAKGYNDKVSPDFISRLAFFFLNTIFLSLQAFAVSSGRRAEKQARRKAEKDQTRLHVPLVNRTPDGEPPPVIVTVVGPPGVRLQASRNSYLSDMFFPRSANRL